MGAFIVGIFTGSAIVDVGFRVGEGSIILYVTSGWRIT